MGRFVSFILIAILFCGFSATSIHADENLVRAKIGILKKSSGKNSRAKIHDRLKAGDLFRIYVHSEAPTNIYIIHSSGKSLSLLKFVRQGISKATVVLPSLQNFYQIDGKSRTEKITIICSPYQLGHAASIAEGALTVQQWEAIEKGLIEKGKIKIGQTPKKPFPLAGNVRGLSRPIDPFMVKLPTYSGNDLLIRAYVFSIEK